MPGAFGIDSIAIVNILFCLYVWLIHARSSFRICWPKKPGMNWEWTGNELGMNWEWTGNEPGMNWEWTGDIGGKMYRHVRMNHHRPKSVFCRRPLQDFGFFCHLYYCCCCYSCRCCFYLLLFYFFLWRFLRIINNYLSLIECCCQSSGGKAKARK